MTFSDAITEANEQGWYLHALHQTGPEELSFHPSTPLWQCTLRASSGPPRREISHGKGDDPIAAICNALGAAPELEAEVGYSDLPPADQPKIDLRAMFLKPKEKMRRI